MWRYLTDKPYDKVWFSLTKQRDAFMIIKNFNVDGVCPQERMQQWNTFI